MYNDHGVNGLGPMSLFRKGVYPNALDSLSLSLSLILLLVLPCALGYRRLNHDVPLCMAKLFNNKREVKTFFGEKKNMERFSSYTQKCVHV